MLNPDLKQNVFYMLKFIIAHNYLAIVYTFGILVGIVISIIKPSRKSVVFLLGSIILLFSFEYNKHIVESFREQTINSLITVQEHNTVRRIVNIVTLKLIPWGLPLIGWVMVLASGLLFFLHAKTLDKKRSKKV